MDRSIVMIATTAGAIVYGPLHVANKFAHNSQVPTCVSGLVSGFNL